MMENDLDYWAIQVKEKMIFNNVKNLAFVIEGNELQKKATIINPKNTEFEQIKESLNMYFHNSKATIMVWGFESNGELLIYKKDINSNFEII